MEVLHTKMNMPLFALSWFGLMVILVLLINVNPFWREKFEFLLAIWLVGGMILSVILFPASEKQSDVIEFNPLQNNDCEIIEEGGTWRIVNLSRMDSKGCKETIQYAMLKYYNITAKDFAMEQENNGEWRIYYTC